jgi:UDP-N-acetylglucosamine pyrophosphorylase
MYILYKGKIELLETTQVPKEHFNYFTKLDFLNYVNANNLRIDFRKLKNHLIVIYLYLMYLKAIKLLKERKQFKFKQLLVVK